MIKNGEIRQLVIAFLRRTPTTRQQIADDLGIGADLPERSDEAGREILRRVREGGLIEQFQAAVSGGTGQ